MRWFKLSDWLKWSLDIKHNNAQITTYSEKIPYWNWSSAQTMVSEFLCPDKKFVWEHCGIFCWLFVLALRRQLLIRLNLAAPVWFLIKLRIGQSQSLVLAVSNEVAKSGLLYKSVTYNLTRRHLFDALTPVELEKWDRYCYSYRGFRSHMSIAWHETNQETDFTT